MASPSNAIPLITCRSCKPPILPYITYTPATPAPPTSTKNLEPIKILTEIPPPGYKYKAVSHVWGTIQPITMVCQACSAKSTIKLKSSDTFDAIMALVEPGSTIWMDNISIDQNDPRDVAKQVAAMGTIYDGAEVVAVMLPPEDLDTFKCLAEMTKVNNLILRHRGRFDTDPQQGPLEDEVSRTLSAAAQYFFALVNDLDRITKKAKYWTRAWTFQEWSLARDVDIALESPDSGGTLRNIKSKAIDTAIRLVTYKMRYGAYAGIDVGFSRGPAAGKLDTVKHLFPSEAQFLAETEKDEAEVYFQTNFPSFGADELLGVRRQQPPAKAAGEMFMIRLTMMLNAFKGGNTRKATFEADKICCWASMCNIDYDYSRDDSLNTAIKKVTRALRNRGLKIYNFQVLGTVPPDIDPTLLAYSFTHTHCNVEDGDPIPGIPFLTGHMDTRTHLLVCLTGATECSLPEKAESANIHIDGVDDYGLLISGLLDLDYALTIFATATSGTPDGIYTDTLEIIKGTLEEQSAESRLLHAVVGVSVPLRPGSDKSFFSWTIVAYPIIAEVLANGHWKFFVGREDLNGTLVLAARKEAGTTEQATLILGYLVVTDNLCGSFLVPISSEGKIRIVYDSIGRSGSRSSFSINKRALEAELKLSSRSPNHQSSVHEYIPGIGNDAALKELESWRETTGNLRNAIRDRIEAGTCKIKGSERS